MICFVAVYAYLSSDEMKTWNNTWAELNLFQDFILEYSR